jgi:hypothetical protein
MSEKMCLRNQISEQELAQLWFGQESGADIAARYQISEDALRALWKRLKRRGIIPDMDRRQRQTNGHSKLMKGTALFHKPSNDEGELPHKMAQEHGRDGRPS